MKGRPLVLAIGAAAAIVAAGMLYIGDRGEARTGVPRAGEDSVWYHASDVALLGRTARPQLVEFFHPG